MEDTYLTITKEGAALFKDKGSKFFGYAFHADTENDLKDRLKALKKEHYSARHHCYAFRVNPENPSYRGNDDGEPSNSAGAPILNQILSNELYNTAVVVVRYFGGVKLGVSGMINAYKSAAAEAIAEAKIERKRITRDLVFKVGYADLNLVMRVIKENRLIIKHQDSYDVVTLTIELLRSEYERYYQLFKELNCVTFKE